MIYINYMKCPVVRALAQALQRVLQGRTTLRHIDVFATCTGTDEPYSAHMAYPLAALIVIGVARRPHDT